MTYKLLAVGRDDKDLLTYETTDITDDDDDDTAPDITAPDDAEHCTGNTLSGHSLVLPRLGSYPE